MLGVSTSRQEWPAGSGRERLFFAVFPGVEAAARISHFRERFVRDNRLDGRLVKSDRLHVSLHHLGDHWRLPTKSVYATSLAGKMIAMAPFEVIFAFIKSFDRGEVEDRARPLVLLGENLHLRELHARLGAEMKRNGLRSAPRFTPHLTLLYGHDPVAMQAVTPVRFTVDEFALVHSTIGLSRYRILARWGLRGELRS